MKKSKYLRKVVLLLVTFGVFALPAFSFAGIITYGNQANFNAQGSIVYNSNFQDFGPFYGLPGDPFTRGDVTYHSTNNLTWGSSTLYTTTEPLIGNNFWTPVLGDISTGPQYNMFGFDIGTYNTSLITITVSTNVGNYVYPSLNIANSQNGLLDFKGFIASTGEYFTGFNISADNGPNNLPGITNVELGHTGGAPVPEPSTFLLFGTGLVGVGFLRRKTRK